MKRLLNRNSALALVASLLASALTLSSAVAADGKRGTVRPKSATGAGGVTTKQERMDRAVDEMAVSSRETAIMNLKRMLKLKRGTPEEPMLLWRLADMEWRSTKNYFRVGVSQGDQSKSHGRYNELLESCVAHTTEILTRFPKFKYYREVLVRRGRTFEELKRKDYALRDYLDYITRYPDGSGTVEVRLMASDVLAEQSRHQDILKILKPVDLSKNHGGLEGQVVEKQALANFNIENYPEALRKAEWLLRYDRKRGVHTETGGHYDEVIGMIALFYGTAFEKKLAGYSLEHAIDYFRKLEGGQIFGKISHEFAMVMRSKEMQAETVEWKNLAMRRMPHSIDTLWIMVDAYDAIINWKINNEFNRIEKDFDTYFRGNPSAVAKAHNLEWFKKFKKTLLEFADKIYATLPKKDPNELDFKVIQGPYLQSLNAYMRITHPTDEVKARVRFRIGEFYTGVKDWDRAQQAFTEVYQAKLFVVKEPELRDQARLRAMTARYDAFKEKGIIPQSLKAAKLTTPKKPLPSDVTEWIKWVDEVAAQKTTQPEVMDKLLFEANRVVYSHGDVDLAYKRMLHYVGTRPNSKLTPAVCALVIDTLIESEAWVATRTLAIKFQQMPNVAVGEFKTKLVSLERDSHYKITSNFFKTKDYAKTKAFGEEHMKLYPDSKHRVDILSMLGKSSLEMKDTEGSLAYMNQVIELAPNHESVGVAYFVRAADLEKKFLFGRAFDDYNKVYKLPADKRGISDGDLPALKRKLFVLGLVADESRTTDALLKGPDFCGGQKSAELRLECDRLAALNALHDEGDRRTAWTFIELAEKAPKESRAAWYAAALSRAHQVPNAVVGKTVEELLKYFDKLDSMTQIEVLATFQVTAPRVFQKKTEVVETNSPVSHRVDDLQQTLQKRVREVQGLEKLAASLIALPSAEVKVRVLGMLAQSYGKIAEDLKKVKTPKGFKDEEAKVLKQALDQMIGPLQQKVAQIGQQTWDIAKQAGLKTPWWDPSIEQMVGSHYADIEVNWKPESSYLESVSDNGKKSPWFEAVRKKRVRPMIFFHQLSMTPQAEKLALDESDKTLLQLASLRAMGLEAEANSLLKEKEPTLKGEALRLGLLTKVFQGVISRSYEAIHAARKAFNDKGLSDESREEGRVLKLAEEVDETITEQLAKAKADAESKAKADAEAAAAQKRAPAQQNGKKAAPKVDEEGLDAVPESQ
jgi:tetratricopeptide (TPR) repeat protein